MNSFHPPQSNTQNPFRSGLSSSPLFCLPQDPIPGHASATSQAPVPVTGLFQVELLWVLAVTQESASLLLPLLLCSWPDLPLHTGYSYSEVSDLAPISVCATCPGHTFVTSPSLQL